MHDAYSYQLRIIGFGAWRTSSLTNPSNNIHHRHQCRRPGFSLDGCSATFSTSTGWRRVRFDHPSQCSKDLNMQIVREGLSHANFLHEKQWPSNNFQGAKWGGQGFVFTISSASGKVNTDGNRNMHALRSHPRMSDRWGWGRCRMLTRARLLSLRLYTFSIH